MSSVRRDIGKVSKMHVSRSRAAVVATLLIGALSISGAVVSGAVAGSLEAGPPADPPKAKASVKKSPAAVPGTATGETSPPGAARAPAPPPAAAANAKSSTTGMPPPPAPANCRNTGSFEGWLAAFRKEAAAEGISQHAIASALDGLTLDQSVIARDRRQGFFAQSFLDFSAKLATADRLQSGRAQIAKNRAAFDRVDKQFGVPAAVITGFWALESDFGAGMGKDAILRSLATLAYDCRRGPMFRDELKAALKIIDRGDMTAQTMIGSWAGEIGQTQFLPTRYLEHAIDYDGDGRPNLFANAADIIGTTANYMTHLGWRRGEPWLEEVRVSDKVPWEQADLAIKLPRSQWAAWGVKRPDGRALPSDALAASLLLPMGRFGPAFLAYLNFDVYLQWNQSLNYATTAAYLATRIEGAPAMSRGQPGIPVLSGEEAKDLQRLLAKQGFDVGEIDGKIGLKTRQAVKVVQKKHGFAADSYPTPELLAALRGGA
jgi:lytic murein transglycosylase